MESMSTERRKNILGYTIPIACGVVVIAVMWMIPPWVQMDWKEGEPFVQKFAPLWSPPTIEEGREVAVYYGVLIARSVGIAIVTSVFVFSALPQRPPRPQTPPAAGWGRKRGHS